MVHASTYEKLAVGSIILASVIMLHMIIIGKDILHEVFGLLTAAAIAFAVLFEGKIDPEEAKKLRNHGHSKKTEDK